MRAVLRWSPLRPRTGGPGFRTRPLPFLSILLMLPLAALMLAALVLATVLLAVLACLLASLLWPPPSVL